MSSSTVSQIKTTSRGCNYTKGSVSSFTDNYYTQHIAEYMCLKPLEQFTRTDLFIRDHLAQECINQYDCLQNFVGDTADDNWFNNKFYKTLMTEEEKLQRFINSLKIPNDGTEKYEISDMIYLLENTNTMVFENAVAKIMNEEITNEIPAKNYLELCKQIASHENFSDWSLDERFLELYAKLLNFAKSDKQTTYCCK